MFILPVNVLNPISSSFGMGGLEDGWKNKMSSVESIYLVVAEMKGDTPDAS